MQQCADVSTAQLITHLTALAALTMHIAVALRERFAFCVCSPKIVAVYVCYRQHVVAMLNQLYCAVVLLCTCTADSVLL